MEIKQVIDVKMSVQYMSFSAHADAKGIMQLISQCEPRNVLLVYGEAAKMDFLKNKIKQEFSVFPPDPKRPRILHGALVMRGNKLRLIDPGQALCELGLEEHQLRFTSTVYVEEDGPPTKTADKIYQLIKSKVSDTNAQYSSDGSITMSDSVLIEVYGDEESKSVLVSWSHQDEDLGSYLLQIPKTGLVT
ncbi:hypothetical protein ScPMuIL_002306 [Solemya velum]